MDKEEYNEELEEIAGLCYSCSPRSGNFLKEDATRRESAYLELWRWRSPISVGWG